MKLPRFISLCAFLPCWVALSGCAALPGLPEPIASRRQERQQAAVEEFERRRDLAQYEAAKARWLEGDAEGCEELLALLLHRSPTHHEGCLLSAELHLTHGQGDLALEPLESILSQTPDDPKANALAAEAYGQLGREAEREAALARAGDAAVEQRPQAIAADAVDQTPDAEANADAQQEWTSARIDDSAQGTSLAPGGFVAEELVGADAGDERLLACSNQVPTTIGDAVATEGTVLELVDASSESSSRRAGGAGATQTRRLAVRSERARGREPAMESEKRRSRTDEGEAARDAFDDSENDAEEIDPRAFEALTEAEALLVEGEVDKARRALRRAVRLDAENWRVGVRAGILALRHAQPQLALEILLPLRGRFPREVAVYRALGIAHYGAGQYEASQVVLQQALSLDSDSALTYFLLGSSLEQLGRTAAAQRHLTTARRLDPRYERLR